MCVLTMNTGDNMDYITTPEGRLIINCNDRFIVRATGIHWEILDKSDGKVVGECITKERAIQLADFLEFNTEEKKDDTNRA